MGLPRQQSKFLLNGATSGLDDGCMSMIAARVRLVHERCTSMSADGQGAGSPTTVIGGARERLVHERCPSTIVHERCTNMRCTRLSSARV